MVFHKPLSSDGRLIRHSIYSSVNHISTFVLLILTIIIIVHITDSALDVFQL
jgi:hypothetical protein